MQNQSHCAGEQPEPSGCLLQMSAAPACHSRAPPLKGTGRPSEAKQRSRSRKWLFGVPFFLIIYFWRTVRERGGGGEEDGEEGEAKQSLY